jgi:hypothetical protein
MVGAVDVLACGGRLACERRALLFWHTLSCRNTVQESTHGTLLLLHAIEQAGATWCKLTTYATSTKYRKMNTNNTLHTVGVKRCQKVSMLPAALLLLGCSELPSTTVIMQLDYVYFLYAIDLLACCWWVASTCSADVRVSHCNAGLVLLLAALRNKRSSCCCTSSSCTR